MHDWAEIRRRVLVEGLSKRAACREFDLHWSTLCKILESPEIPGYRQPVPRAKPKLGEFLPIIHRILEEDRSAPPKQRHSATRIYHRLSAEFGYRGGRSVVDDAVRAWKRQQAQMFVPLEHRPGEAQADFGHALVQVGSRLVKTAFLVMSLPFSSAVFCRAFPRECTETFQDGHARAFEFFGGVPRRISYDNSRIAVSRLTGQRGNKLTQQFINLRSHYLFESHFCRVRRPNEKGHVENMVGFCRRNFLVPVPVVNDFESLNEQLLVRCNEDLARELRGKGRTKAALLEEERTALLPLPAAPFAACRVDSTGVSSLSLVRFDRNDYSVPVAFGHRQVTVRGGIDTVRIECDGIVVAQHARCWERHRTIFNPIHYLPLLERKPGALDHARPLADWSLPACFDGLRARLEADDPESGTVEFIRVLRLMEFASLEELSAVIEVALCQRNATADVIRLLLENRRQRPSEPLSLENRPRLQAVHVPRPDLTIYQGLLAPGEVLS